MATHWRLVDDTKSRIKNLNFHQFCHTKCIFRERLSSGIERCIKNHKCKESEIIKKAYFLDFVYEEDIKRIEKVIEFFGFENLDCGKYVLLSSNPYIGMIDVSKISFDNKKTTCDILKAHSEQLQEDPERLSTEFIKSLINKNKDPCPDLTD